MLECFRYHKQTCSKALLTKIVWHLCKARLTDDGAEQNLERDPLTCSHPIYGRGDTAVHWKRDSLFSKCCSINCYLEREVSRPLTHFIHNGLET